MQPTGTSAQCSLLPGDCQQTLAMVDTISARYNASEHQHRTLTVIRPDTGFLTGKQLAAEPAIDGWWQGWVRTIGPVTVTSAPCSGAGIASRAWPMPEGPWPNRIRVTPSTAMNGWGSCSTARPRPGPTSVSPTRSATQGCAFPMPASKMSISPSAAGLDRRRILALARGDWIKAREQIILTGQTGTGIDHQTSSDATTWTKSRPLRKLQKCLNNPRAIHAIESALMPRSSAGSSASTCSASTCLAWAASVLKPRRITSPGE